MPIVEKHYDAAIASRLRFYVDARQWTSLLAYLDKLSHANFRTAGYILGESIMPGLPASDFWHLLTLLNKYNRKAFLVTSMKAARNRKQEFRLPEAEAVWRLLAENETDATKTLQTLLPDLHDDVELASHLLDVMLAGKTETRIAILLRTETRAAAFLLLRALRMVEHNRQLLIRTTCFLMKRGDPLSFNLASLFKCFFGLEEVKGTFSLRLQPYELARLETNYEAFCQKIATS